MMITKQNTVHFDFSSCFLNKKGTVIPKALEKARDLATELKVNKVSFIVDNLSSKEEQKRFRKEIVPDLQEMFNIKVSSDIVTVSDLFSKVAWIIPKEQEYALHQSYHNYAKRFPKVLEGIYQMYASYGILPKSGVMYFVSNAFDSTTLYRVGNLDVICMRL